MNLLIIGLYISALSEPSLRVLLLDVCIHYSLHLSQQYLQNRSFLALHPYTMSQSQSTSSTSSSTPNPITIRDAQISDAQTIAELGAHVFSETFAHSVQPHELEAFLEESYTTSAIRKDLQDTTRDVIVAADADDKIVGFAYLTRDTSEPCIADVEDKVELQRIYVDTSTHGKGIGGMLAGRIEEMAREQGFKNIWLGVWEENDKARRAYERWGYRQVGDHDFVVGTVVQTDHILLKRL